MEFVVDEDYAGQRLDKVLTALCGDLTRARVQALMAEGAVRVDGIVTRQASRKVKMDELLAITVPEPEPATPQPQDIPLDVVYEDGDLLVVNKPVGLVVHAGAGNVDGTLVNALLHHCGDSLSGIGGVMRPGIVHRLDKETSGLLVVAKNDFAHQGLAAQLADRSLSRVYQALVFKVPQPLVGTVDQPLGRSPRNRLKIMVRGGFGSRDAQTHYHVKQRYGDACALVECKLQTGRTHQIRVHMAHLGHNLIGDPLYGAQPTAVRAALKREMLDPEIIEEIVYFPRQALHAWKLSFIHPRTQEQKTFEAPLPDDFSNLLKSIDKIAST